MKYRMYLLFLLSLITLSGFSRGSCYSELKNDTLVIGNNLIERKFSWNSGNLISHSLTDKIANHTWINKSDKPDFIITKDLPAAVNSSYNTRQVKETVIRPSYLEVIVVYTLHSLEIKRIYRIYDNVPAISCHTWLKGSTNSVFGGRTGNLADRKNIEFAEDMESKQVNPVLEHFNFGGNHWHMKTVEFYDITDWNDNLVFEKNVIPYRKNNYRGNLLLACNAENEKGFFFLKEAPCSDVQLAYNDHDFTAEFGHFAVTGLGISESDIKLDEWVGTYGYVTGVYSGGELSALKALRTYQKNVRKLLPDRDEMIMMNTWGDRSQDSKINEKFSLLEVERATRLGITHFQIDDGWQVGKSPNSILAKGSFKNIWDNPDYWKPDPVKYPRGLHPIVKRGKELGIEICLWFNPCVQNDYADWQKDAGAMIDLYKEYGIRTFKIDGLSVPTKQSEINLRKLFDKVLEETEYRVVFNLDATAGRRGGYHLFNEYGNIFLENRYTDWQNYYPYRTLRNLWQLSKYVPAEKLQIEFLNKWRNTEKYGNDLFAPSNYSFEYLFAITMAGQPLAWFEGSGLPEEALTISNLIAEYKKIQHDFHRGIILPIGEEPSGKSWTGFQSLHDGRGYFIVFRENNPESKYPVKTRLEEGTKVKCTRILGSGKSFSRTCGREGTVEIEIADINNFAMYTYEIEK